MAPTDKSPENSQPRGSGRLNRIELWLESVSVDQANAFIEYATECQDFPSLLAYLVQEGAPDIPHNDLRKWMKTLQGKKAESISLANQEYLGVETTGTLDRIVVELSNQLDLINDRINGNLSAGHPLYDEMTFTGAMKLRTELIQQLRSSVTELEKKRASAERNSLVWGAAARLRAIFMGHHLVRDTEHESWCEELWGYCLHRLEEELKRVK